MTHGDRQVWIVVLVVVSLCAALIFFALVVRNVDTDLGLVPTTTRTGG